MVRAVRFLNLGRTFKIALSPIQTIHQDGTCGDGELCQSSSVTSSTSQQGDEPQTNGPGNSHPPIRTRLRAVAATKKSRRRPRGVGKKNSPVASTATKRRAYNRLIGSSSIEGGALGGLRARWAKSQR